MSIFNSRLGTTEASQCPHCGWSHEISKYADVVNCHTCGATYKIDRPIQEGYATPPDLSKLSREFLHVWPVHQSHDRGVIALVGATDGTLWELNDRCGYSWTKIPPLPSPERVK